MVPRNVSPSTALVVRVLAFLLDLNALAAQFSMVMWGSGSCMVFGVYCEFYKRRQEIVFYCNGGVLCAAETISSNLQVSSVRYKRKNNGEGRKY